ncbi:MAG: 2-hydroxyacyl-CoA dehydratase family protein [candidate division WOR-3 bacterium]
MKNLIGYTCSYIPVELLSATGYKPYRLLHGDIRLSSISEVFVRTDACPLVKSNLGFIAEHKEEFVAIVGATGCDMGRRMIDIVSEITDLPVFLLNNPRTDKREIFDDEIDWLAKELEQLSRIKFTERLIEVEIEKWERARALLREVDRKRAQNPSQAATTDFHKILIKYYQGDIEGIETTIRTVTSDKPRVYLIGAPVSYEINYFLELVEYYLRIVGDFNCGLSRILNLNIKEKNLKGIKDAYYHQPSCIFKRTNMPFYDFIKTEVKRLACSGIIAWSLDFCDNYEFAMAGFEAKIDLPVLKLRGDYSLQNLSQLKTRINAFAEMLRDRRPKQGT